MEVVSIGVALILVLGLVTMFIIQTVVRQDMNKSGEQLTDFAINYRAKDLEEIFDVSKNLVSIIASDKEIISFLRDEEAKKNRGDEMNEKLLNYNSGNNYSAIYLIGKDGRTRASTDRSFIDQDYSFRQYFKEAMRGENYADVNVGVTSKKMGYYFSSPIKIDNEVVGVAVIKMNPEIVFSFLKEECIAALSDLMVVDRFGIVVGANRDGLIFKSLGKISQDKEEILATEDKYPNVMIDSLSYQEILNELQYIGNEVRDFKTYDNLNKRFENIIVTKVGEYNFFLVAKIDDQKVAFETGLMFRKIGGVILVIMFFGSVLMLFLMSSRLNPLEQLLVMSRKISMGDFDYKNPVKQKNDLAELGETMETMAMTIKHRWDELEKMVEERTEKLNEQAKSMENTKLAVNNILDDVEGVASDLEKYKMAVDNSSDCVVITDLEGVVIYVNKAVERVTGFSTYEVIGKKAGSKVLWGGQMPKEFYEKLWKTIKSDKKVFEGELNNHSKNGRPYISRLTISPILSNSDEVLYFVGVERDITREKEVDRSKTDFIYLTSHQLRTPLSAMKWFCEMLLAGDAGELTKDQREFVENISQSNERMIDLINSLLNISRVESGRIIIDPTPTDLEKLVQDVLTELDKNIKEKKQEVLLSVSDSLPRVNVDPKLIREVYKNLLTNANKYTQEGGRISVIISVEGGEVVSQISDNGMGIPVADQSKIFERFFRAENIIKLETEGTGLGLYLAKAIVESSMGKIWFKSQEKVGTNFWFTLPLSGVKAHKGQVSINS
ncbi:MAG TPA: ATP-binding protein [Candidatus Methanoperedens sp.]|nr:ATP-binding protein [Candidatus Methanoperedens sp.]